MRQYWTKPGSGSKQDLRRFFESVACLMSNQIRSTVYSTVEELASFFERYTVTDAGQGPITGACWIHSSSLQQGLPAQYTVCLT